MEGLKQRQEDLENREFQLRASLETYDTFITVSEREFNTLEYIGL